MLKRACGFANLILLTLSVYAGAQALWATRAWAGLGEWDSSIEDDRLSMAGNIRSAVNNGKYTVIEITSPSRTVREYVNAEGKVFAVTWRGINHPDFARVMGGYYGEYKEALSKHLRGTARSSHNMILTPKAIVVRSGHMRDFRGKAYDQSLIPQGVSINDLR